MTLTKENKLEHECFPQPENGNICVWRYLDLAKLISIFDNSSLYLSRLDLLNDPHEGSTPRKQAIIRNREFQLRNTTGTSKVKELLIRCNEHTRKTVYVNCWHLGDTESEAMWRIYGANNEGIAIKTTYNKLLDSVIEIPRLYIGMIKYIDYEAGYFPETNMYYRVMHKRLSFQHEKEIRLVVSPPETWHIESELGPEGIKIDWDFINVIDGIYVNPYANEYYYESVKVLIEKFAPVLIDKLRWSQMKAAPVY